MLRKLINVGLLLFVTVVLGMLSTEGQENTESESHFSDFCRSRLKKVQERCRHISFRLYCVTSADEGPREWMFSEICQDGRYVQIRAVDARSEAEAIGLGAPELSEFSDVQVRAIYISNPSYETEIRKNTAGKYEINYLNPIVDDKERGHSFGVFPFGIPYLQISFDKILVIPHRNLRWEDNGTIGKLQVVLLESGNVPAQEIEAEFDSTIGRCRKLVRRETKSKTIHDYTIHYVDDSDHAFMSSVECRLTFPDESNGTKRILQKVTFKTIDLPLDRKKCLLTYYGLPEPSLPVAKPSIWMYILAAGVITMTVGVIILILKSKSRKGSQARHV